MSKEIVYWTMKDGKKISVDDMDITHLRNSLKMIVRKMERVQAEIKAELQSKSKPKFQIHGDIAQDMIDQGYLNEYLEDFDQY